jgi:hypothetical protein
MTVKTLAIRNQKPAELQKEQPKAFSLFRRKTTEIESAIKTLENPQAKEDERTMAAWLVAAKGTSKQISNALMRANFDEPEKVSEAPYRVHQSNQLNIELQDTLVNEFARKHMQYKKWKGMTEFGSLSVFAGAILSLVFEYQETGTLVGMMGLATATIANIISKKYDNNHETQAYKLLKSGKIKSESAQGRLAEIAAQHSPQMAYKMVGLVGGEITSEKAKDVLKRTFMTNIMPNGKELVQTTPAEGKKTGLNIKNEQ